MNAIQSFFNLGVDQQYIFRSLVEKDLEQMHRTFSESFADYAVPDILD